MYIAPVIEKKHDLSFKVNTQIGYGHLRRNVSNVNCNFEVPEYGQRIFDLPAGGSVTMSAASVIQILPTGPILLTCTNDDDSEWTIEVRRLLILDSPVKQWVLHNGGTTSVTVRTIWAAESQ